MDVDASELLKARAAQTPPKNGNGAAPKAVPAVTLVDTNGNAPASDANLNDVLLRLSAMS